MRWTVEGFDPNTRANGAITVEARSEEEAQDQARYNGLMPSRAYPAGAGGSAPARAAAPAPLAAPGEYRDIVRGAAGVRTFASVAAGVGWALVLVAVAIGGVVAARWHADDAGFIAGPLGLLSAMSILASALWFFIVAAVLRLFASLALAHRDLVRKTR